MTALRQRVLYLLAAFVLAACGGGGGGAGGETDISQGTDGPPGGAGTGSVATFTDAKIPYPAVNYVATNRGVYMSVVENVATTEHRILKLHGSPTWNDWSVATIPRKLRSFAPVNVHSEAERAVSFYWVGESVTDEQMWGIYRANDGGVSTTLVDDLFISNVAAGGVEGVVTTRPWVRDMGGNIRQDDGVYTTSSKTSDRFGTPVTGPVPTGETPAMLSHPKEPLLFFGSGDTLTVYGRTQVEESTRLPPPTGLTLGPVAPFSDFTWYDGELWFAYGDKVYRRTSAGELKVFADVPVPGQSGRFCIQGGEVLTPDGNAVRISDGTKRSWVAAGDLTPEQILAATALSGMLAIYCSPMGQGVYVPRGDTVRIVIPI